MKSLIVNILDDDQGKVVYKLLSEVKNVTVEELNDSVYEDLSKEDIQVLNDRLADYEKNPGKAISLHEFKENLKSKYGYSVTLLPAFEEDTSAIYSWYLTQSGELFAVKRLLHILKETKYENLTSILTLVWCVLILRTKAHPPRSATNPTRINHATKCLEQ